MIVVKIQENVDGKIIGYKLEGHSNIAPRGFDIICAGVSTLAQITLYGLRDYLRFNVECKIDDGLFDVKLKGIPDSRSEALLRTMLIGLNEFATKAPQIVSIVYL